MKYVHISGLVLVKVPRALWNLLIFVKGTMEPVDYSKIIEMFCEIEANFLFVFDFEFIAPALVMSFRLLAFVTLFWGLAFGQGLKPKAAIILF